MWSIINGDKNERSRDVTPANQGLRLVTEEAGRVVSWSCTRDLTTARMVVAAVVHASPMAGVNLSPKVLARNRANTSISSYGKREIIIIVVIVRY